MLKVLYVDDEPSLLELAKAFLESEGDLEVATCGSGHEVLNLLPTEHFDALISDYQMPEMDGLELLRAIRHRYPALPFVLFTGKGREEVAMEALRHGADSYIMKGGDATSQFKMLANEVKLAAARREAEEAVHYNLFRFNLIMKNLSEVILIASESGRITYVSPSVNSVLGYQREDIEGKNLDDVWHLSNQGQKKPQTVVGKLVEMLREEGTLIELPAKDGSIRRLHGKATKVSQGDEKIIIATLKDVTHVRDLEDQLTTKERLFSVVLDQMPMACGVSDLATGKLLLVNAKFVETLGYPRETLLGRNSVEASILDLQAWTEALRTIKRKRGDHVKGVEVMLDDVHGNKQSFEMSGMRVDMDDESYLVFILYPRDGWMGSILKDIQETSGLLNEMLEHEASNSKDASFV